MPESTRRSTSGRRRSVNRRQVLDVATRVFAASGYRGANLNLVAAELGVTRQALYYHFDSKDEILGALFESLMSKLETRALGVGDVGERQSRLGILLLGHAEVTLANLTLSRLVISERRTLDGIEWLGAADRRRDYTDLFEAAYRDAVAAGQLRPLSVEREAEAILVAINAVCVQREFSWTGANSPELLVDLVAGGILGGGLAPTPEEGASRQADQRAIPTSR